MSIAKAKNGSVVEANDHGDDLSVRHTDDDKLAELGYKSEFKREFSLLQTIAFSISVMGVIASISSTIGFGLAGGGHMGLVFGWFIASIFVMMVALSMAELASSMPYVRAHDKWSIMESDIT
ncbi:hypothetical protein H0H87_002688 [Tephrocybe sp. NHM501043]|nr:hypothetical protein H0H87_002688 [Tephrocybe sp. NHM501043]